MKVSVAGRYRWAIVNNRQPFVLARCHRLDRRNASGRSLAIRRGVPLSPIIPAITPDLLKVSAACHVADAHPGPAELRHHSRKQPIGTGRSSVLRNFEKIEYRLCADTLKPIVIDFALDAPQAQLPRMRGILCGNLSLSFFQFIKKRHRLFSLHPIIATARSGLRCGLQDRASAVDSPAFLVLTPSQLPFTVKLSVKFDNLAKKVCEIKVQFWTWWWT
jgi:hypothetical protein